MSTLNTTAYPALAMESQPLTKPTKRLILTQLMFPIALLVLGIWGGLMQAAFRAGVIQDDPIIMLLKLVGLVSKDYIMPDQYYRGLTLHGVVNAVVFTTFFAVAFANALVPYTLKKSLNSSIAWLANALMIVGTLMAAGAILSGNASVLYTFYPPLKAHWSFYVGATLLVIGSWISFYNWIPLYLSWRRENPSEKTPLAVVGIFATFIVWQFATAALAVEVLVLLLPWSLGFVETVNVPLARTLFWFFGHPLVYFWILPAYVMYYTMLPKLVGGKLFSDGVGRAVFFLFIIFSTPVGAHHQYTEPAISSGSKMLHAILTFAVGFPSFLTAFTMAATMEYAAHKRGVTSLLGWTVKQPFFNRERWLFSYLIAGLFIFIFGGITGIINSSYSMNVSVHNTSWMPGHFHMTVGGPVFLAFLGMSLWLLEKVGGKDIKFPKLAMLVPYLWIGGMMLFSWSLMQSGLHGEPRRTNMGLTYTNPDSPLYRADWAWAAKITLIGGSIMFLAMLLYFLSFFATAFSKKVRSEQLAFPLSEALHNERVGIFANFRPWLIGEVILLIVAYTPVFYDLSRGTFNNAPGYSPLSPVPETSTTPPAQTPAENAPSEKTP
jgi:cytochrome c oxidase subunit 1